MAKRGQDSTELYGVNCLSLRGIAEPAVAADGAGIAAFRGMKSLQSAPLLNFFVLRAKS